MYTCSRIYYDTCLLTEKNTTKIKLSFALHSCLYAKRLLLDR